MYHAERPHQSKDNEPLVRATPDSPKKKRKSRKQAEKANAVPLAEIERKQRLGGLLKHYSRKAA